MIRKQDYTDFALKSRSDTAESTTSFPLGEARVIHPADPPARILRGLTREQRREALRKHREAWLDLRGIGGSDASTLLGFNPHSSLLALWSDKTGRTPPSPGSDAARVGRMLEAGVLELFRDETGLATRRIGMLARKDCSWMTATPDALASDGGGVEIKTTTERNSGQWDAHPSDHAMAQAQWGMWVHGSDHWYVAVLFRDSGRFLWYQVERDQHMIDVLRERAAVFWHSYVLTDTAPPLEGREADLEATHDINYAGSPALPEGAIDGGEPAAVCVRSLVRVNARIGDLKKIKRARETELARIIGNSTRLYANGTLVATYERNGTMATKRYRAECERSREFLVLGPVLDKDRALREDPDALRYVSRKLLLKTSGDRAKREVEQMSPPLEGSEAAWLAGETAKAEVRIGHF